jgi:microcystin-dependent protein
MSSVIFSNAQRIIAQIFDWLQLSSQNRITNLITDTFSAGIDNATTSGEGFLVVPGTNNTSANPSVNVTLGGIAYDPLGNRIYISPSDVTLYNPSNITATTNDGLGNFLSTPQSSGVVNIPVTQSSLNYLWIDYLPTIDTTAFTLNEETNAKIFYKQTDGYSITVTTTNTPPDANSIFLASVDMTGGGAVASSNISQVGRTYYEILPKIVPIVTPFNNGSNRTPSYNQNTRYTLDAHIKSIGTGTGISPFNPHNMSLADLGVSTLDTVVGRSQIEGNNNVILAGTVGNPFPSASAMATSIAIVNPGSDYIIVQQLLPSEFVIVNGAAYNVTDIFGAIPTNANVFFPDASGFYYVYWDSVTRAFAVSLTNISADVTKLLLATVTYTFVGHVGSDHNALSGLTDLRLIGGTTNLLQRWTTLGRPTNPVVGEFGFNITLNTFEYWDGTAWQQVVTASSNSTVPTGSLLPFAGTSAPAGFLLANGASVSTGTYPNLFAAIGYTYGGAGASFNLPQMAGFVPVGIGGSLALGLGGTTGSTTHTLTTAELPTAIGSATSTVTDPSHVHGERRSDVGGSDAGIGSTSGHNGNAAGIDTLLHTDPATTGITVSTTITNSGGGGSHNIVQPSIGVNYIIKT